jgi:hypothetical protein
VARHITLAGQITAIAYLGETALAGGVISSSSFTAVPNLGFLVATDSFALLGIEFAFSSGTSATKEVIIDSTVVTRA